MLCRLQTIALLSQCITSLAATVTYDWNITWVTANPDGLLERPVIGINDQWPPPVLNVTKGDTVIANVYNRLGNESTSIHFHGLYQNGTTHMDGPVGVVQCEIPPGYNFTYKFTVDQIGTYWYHSHTRGQYPDGLRQALVITDPENPYAGQYDEERLFSVSDWYHDQMPVLLKEFINVANPTGAEPVPNSAMLNDTANFSMDMEPGKTYLFRIVNVGAFSSHYFWIEDHTMQIVEVDGIWTSPAETDMLYITAAQRYSILVTAKNATGKNYPIVSSMDLDLFDAVPDTLNWNVTGWLVYNESAALPKATNISSFAPYDDFALVPTDNMERLPAADYTVTLDLSMDNLGDGANYAFFNDISYVSPKVPTLYSVMSVGETANDPTVYGGYTNSYVLEKDDIVDIVLNNADTGKHPFHLHGHAFQVIYRSPENEGYWQASNESLFPSVPMRRDTLYVKPLGNFVVRFKADNPGVWFFHCHIDWHLVSGLAAVMIEAPLELQKTLTIPNSHFELCNASGTLYKGNAAGNVDDFTDLSGQNTGVARLPNGFTARGIAAIVFSGVSAFVGMGVISWYGMAPV